MAEIFTPRTKAPEQDNKYYRLIAGGGVSPCIAGRPNYSPDGKSALNNCVGYSWGRMAELEQDPAIKVGCYPGHSYPSDAYVWLSNSQKQGGSASDHIAHFAQNGRTGCGGHGLGQCCPCGVMIANPKILHEGRTEHR